MAVTKLNQPQQNKQLPRLISADAAPPPRLRGRRVLIIRTPMRTEPSLAEALARLAAIAEDPRRSFLAESSTGGINRPMPFPTRVRRENGLASTVPRDPLNYDSEASTEIASDLDSSEGINDL